jgi:hypothetical protein
MQFLECLHAGIEAVARWRLDRHGIRQIDIRVRTESKGGTCIEVCLIFEPRS